MVDHSESMYAMVNRLTPTNPLFSLRENRIFGACGLLSILMLFNLFKSKYTTYITIII